MVVAGLDPNKKQNQKNEIAGKCRSKKTRSCCRKSTSRSFHHVRPWIYVKETGYQFPQNNTTRLETFRQLAKIPGENGDARGGVGPKVHPPKRSELLLCFCKI